RGLGSGYGGFVVSGFQSPFFSPPSRRPTSGSVTSSLDASHSTPAAAAREVHQFSKEVSDDEAPSSYIGHFRIGLRLPVRLLPCLLWQSGQWRLAVRSAAREGWPVRILDACRDRRHPRPPTVLHAHGRHQPEGPRGRCVAA